MRFSSATYTDDRIKRTSEIGEARSRRRNVAFFLSFSGIPLQIFRKPETEKPKFRSTDRPTPGGLAPVVDSPGSLLFHRHALKI